MPTLEWIGKEKVINHDKEVPFKLLDAQYTFDEKGKREGEADSGNKIIHGDNLLALKALLPKYQGKIKCIYIDPPYNTGNEGWVYNDKVSDPQIKKWLGEVVGKEGEDLSRHDKWLCMMYPRLKLLQQLLAEDGAIYISVDDNEISNLRLICNEIFGRNNFIANIVWKKKTNGNNMGAIPAVHDFILVYSKNFEKLQLLGIPLSEEYLKNKYSNPDNDCRGLWTTTDLSANHKGPFFPITNPETGQVFYPPEGRYWVFNEKEVQKRIQDGRIIFGKTGKTRPVQKIFAKDRNLTQKPDTWFDSQGYNSDGMLMLSAILGKKVFDNPKPVSLLEYLLAFNTTANDIVLDSFAGSGTTAHAVLSLNKKDGGNRKFILVEMMDYADSITAERVKHVINGYGEGEKTVEGTGGSFTYYELGESLFDEDGNLNANVPAEKIREYVWYMETKLPLPHETETAIDNAAFLGVCNHIAYYFHYDANCGTTLDHEFLSSVRTEAESYVIYADACALSDAFLTKNHITFKKIPRDIERL